MSTTGISILIIGFTYLMSLFLLALFYQTMDLNKYETSKTIRLLFRLSTLVAPLTFTLIFIGLMSIGIYSLVVDFFNWLFHIN